MSLCVCVNAWTWRPIACRGNPYTLSPNPPKHRPVLDTCANEAIPRWGKGGLIKHPCLQMRPTQNNLKCVASIMGRIVKLSLHSCCNLSLSCLVLSAFLRISTQIFALRAHVE